jgi:ABC-type multidrug transport system fused ATPase/permease subunit
MMLMLLAPLKSLVEVNGPLQRGMASAETVFAMIDAPVEPTPARAARPRERPPALRGRVVPLSGPIRGAGERHAGRSCPARRWRWSASPAAANRPW